MDHQCQYLEDPSEHVFTKSVMTLYDDDREEIASREFDVPPAYGGVQSCFIEFFQTGAEGAKCFSIRAHYDDGCISDWESFLRQPGARV